MPTRKTPNRVATLWRPLLLGACLAATGLVPIQAVAEAPADAPVPPLRMAISERVVWGVGVDDARAATAVWTTALLKNINVKMEMAPDQAWVLPSDQLLAAIRGRKEDLFCITVQEYRHVTAAVDTSRLITDNYGGDELLLVVRGESGMASLRDLRGRSLLLWESPSTTLAEPWLAVAVGQEGLGTPRQLLTRVTTNTKLAQVVLPVFFGQSDACVVTRRGWDTMVELNPQLSRKLKVMMASPPMEGVFFACRRDYPARLRNSIFDGLLTLKSSPPARQILTLFQSPGFTDRNADCLRPAMVLLDAYERLGAPVAVKAK